MTPAELPFLIRDQPRTSGEGALCFAIASFVVTRVTDHFCSGGARPRQPTLTTYDVLGKRLHPNSPKRVSVTFATKVRITEKRKISSPALFA